MGCIYTASSNPSWSIDRRDEIDGSDCCWCGESKDSHEITDRYDCLDCGGTGVRTMGDAEWKATARTDLEKVTPIRYCDCGAPPLPPMRPGRVITINGKAVTAV